MGAIGPLCINVLMYAKMPYDPLKDLAPVVQTATVPLILVVHPSLPTKNVKEFIALMKARAGQFNYASAGSGSPQHLTAELFKTMAKVDMNHIPYKGSGPALIDLVGGQVPFAFESTIPVLPYIKSGRLRALGITSAQRWPLVPDLPTVADGGVPGFEAITWYGVAAPAAVPADIVKRLNAEITRVLNLPDIKQRLADLGTPMVAGTPEQFGALIRSEVVKWGKVVKQANVKLD
jgi:tripartite-type tricarboxylate transporter receptor subunit TctC